MWHIESVYSDKFATIVIPENVLCRRWVSLLLWKEYWTSRPETWPSHLTFCFSSEKMENIILPACLAHRDFVRLRGCEITLQSAACHSHG